MLPSSTLDVTAFARSNEPRFCRVEDCLEGTVDPVILDLMISVKLDRLLAFGGFNSMFGAKLNNLSQEATFLLFIVISRKVCARAVQQAGRADLGMCLINAPLIIGWLAI